MSNNLAFSSSWEPSDSQQQDLVNAEPPTAYNPEHHHSQPQPQAYAHSTLGWRLPATRPADPSSGGDPRTSGIHQHRTTNASPTIPGGSTVAAAAANIPNVPTGSKFMYGTEVGRNRASSNVMHPTTTKSVRGEFDWSSVKVLMLDHDDNLCERGDNNNNNGNGRAIARGSQQQMDGTVDSQEERQDKRHRRTMSMLHEVEKTLRKLHDDKKQQQNMLEREMSAVKHEIILLRQSIDRMNKLMDDNDNNNNNVSNNKNANAFRNRNMSFGMYIDTVNMETAKILDKCKMIDSIECDRKRKIQIESMQKRKREKSDKRRQQASQQQHRYQQRQQQQQQQQRRPVYVNVQVKSENAEVRPVQFVDQTQGNDDAIAQNSPPSPPTMQRRRGVIMQEDISSIGDLDLDVRTENECQDHLHVDPNPCNRDNTNETEDDEERYTQFLNASFSFNGSSTESSDFLC